MLTQALDRQDNPSVITESLEHSKEGISFLDVQVNVGEGGVLTTDLFASQLIEISTCKKRPVIFGIQKRRFLIARQLGYAGYVLMIADF